MLFALNRRLAIVPVTRSTQLVGRLFVRSFAVSPTARHTFTEYDEDGDNMANMDAKAPKGGAVTLKTPKGTRDWSGGDMLLREEVL